MMPPPYKYTAEYKIFSRWGKFKLKKSILWKKIIFYQKSISFYLLSMARTLYVYYNYFMQNCYINLNYALLSETKVCDPTRMRNDLPQYNCPKALACVHSL